MAVLAIASWRAAEMARWVARIPGTGRAVANDIYRKAVAGGANPGAASADRTPE